jgi:hypothetical protein
VLESVTANKAPAVADNIAKPINPKNSHNSRYFLGFGNLRKVDGWELGLEKGSEPFTNFL